MNKLIIILCLCLFQSGLIWAGEYDGHPGHQQLLVDQEANATFWTCSMHPQIQLPVSGQCPICFMDLIEVERQAQGEDVHSLRQISFGPEAQKLAQVEVSVVREAEPVSTIRMVGKVEYDETLLGRITARVSGRIDRLDIAYTGAVVSKGQIMAQIYSPELLTAQAELIQAEAATQVAQKSNNELVRQSANRTLRASRDKLQLLGLSTDQIAEIIVTKKAADHIGILAPMGGIVITKEVVEGMYVKTGAPLFIIADLRKLWVVLEAYEPDLGQITLGQEVEFQVEAYPGRPFMGQVAYIDPLVDAKSRTVRVRLNVDNSEGRLLPGMFVQAEARYKKRASGKSLMIPASAPLITGKRALVYIEIKEGVYEGRVVVLGVRTGDYFVVRSGLVAGDKVVSRGAFKIDSAMQIQAKPSMMNSYPGPATPQILPGLGHSKLILLQEQFFLLTDQVHAAELRASLATGAKMATKLAELDPNDLSEENRLIWQELKMVLSADLFLLQEAEDVQDLARIYAEMASHFQKIRLAFKLPDRRPILGSAPLRQALTAFVEGYLALQAALAQDDDKVGGQRITALGPLVGPLALELAKTSDYQQLGVDIRSQIVLLEKAATLQDMRTEFYPLSQTLSELVGQFSLDLATPLYKQYCPMAFGNKGAIWLADSAEINNPYFGAMMLRCGEVKEQLQD